MISSLGDPDQNPSDNLHSRNAILDSAHRSVSIMLNQKTELVAYAIVIALAFATRMWDLGGRSLHYDEILHAWYAWVFASGDGYSHTPLTHGPFLFHLTAAVYKIFGSNDITSRLLPALFGVTLVGMPYFLRRSIGKPAALIAAIMLLASPSTLYFSRFIRNDVFMAVWVLSLIIIVFTYIERPRKPLLLLWSVLWALSFATKESSYIIAGIMSVLLLALSWREIPRAGSIKTRIDKLPPAAILLLVLVTLSLPLWGASMGLFQDWLGVILVTPDPNELAGKARETSIAVASQVTPLKFWISIALAASLTFLVAIIILMKNWSNWRNAIPGVTTIVLVVLTLGFGVERALSFGNDKAIFIAIFDRLKLWIDAQPIETGAPQGAGTGLAIGITLGLSGIATTLGLLWNYRFWPWLATCFSIIWFFLFTSIGSNMQGFFTGIWGSLGYWVAQQPVERASQPWFYYLLTVCNYEFLALIPAIIALPYLIIRGNHFDRFLVGFSTLMFVAFSYAGEKMPWLTMGLTLPIVLVAARGLGLMIESRIWGKVTVGLLLSGMAWGAALMGAALLALLTVLSFEFRWISYQFIFATLGTLLSVTALYIVMRKQGILTTLSLSGLGMIIVMLGFTVFIAGRSNYSYSMLERPSELLVYSQSGQEITYTARMIEQLSEDSGKGKQGIHILVGQSDNFGWQWRWYLRDYINLELAFLNETTYSENSEIDVIMMSKSAEKINQKLLQKFTKVADVHHLWWFPNTVYKDITVHSLFHSLLDKEGWRRPVHYFLYRDMKTQMYQSKGSVYVADRHVPLIQIRRPASN